MLSGDIGIHTRRINLYENERYIPLSGWSSKALMLTDRSVFSNSDGTDGFATMEEANQSLLSLGWQWDETPWMIDKGIAQETDEDGWRYSSDFTSFSSENPANTNISGRKGLMHFVRRRRLVRNQSFDGENSSFLNVFLFQSFLSFSLVQLFCNVMTLTCDHCDLKEVEKLSVLFLEKFAQATMKKHPRNLSPSKVNVLKSLLVLSLQLSDQEVLDQLVLQASAPSSSSSASVPVSAKRSSSISYFSSARSKSLGGNGDGEGTAVAVPVKESSGEGGEKEQLNIDKENDKEEQEDKEKSVASSSEEIAKEKEKTSSSSSSSSASLSLAQAAVSHNIPGIVSKYSLSSSSGGYSFLIVDQLLESFVQSSSTALSMASSLIGGSSVTSNEYYETRKNEIAQRYFSTEERIELAKLLLRKFDHLNAFHCPRRNCGLSCEFRIEQCSNEHCFVYFSHKWWEEHDAICPEKLLFCERGCQESALRKNMNHHLSQECSLRPVVCPYQCIGCARIDLLAKDLSPHIQEELSVHMELVLERLLEHQKVFSTVYSRLSEVESVNAQTRKEIAVVQSGLVTATIALKASETRQEKQLQDQIKALDNKISRTNSSLQSEIRSEISKVQSALPKK
jgi:hypothetical protein